MTYRIPSILSRIVLLVQPGKHTPMVSCACAIFAVDYRPRRLRDIDRVKSRSGEHARCRSISLDQRRASSSYAFRLQSVHMSARSCHECVFRDLEAVTMHSIMPRYISKAAETGRLRSPLNLSLACRLLPKKATTAQRVVLTHPRTKYMSSSLTSIPTSSPVANLCQLSMFAFIYCLILRS